MPTIDDMRRACDAYGVHWFDPGAMRYFGTRFGRVYSGPGGVYFVTSETPGRSMIGEPPAPRRYTVRRFDRNTGANAEEGPAVATIGRFWSLTRDHANRRAASLAAGLVRLPR